MLHLRKGMPSVFKIVRIICFVVSLGYSLQCSAQAFDLNTGISYQKIFVYEDTMGRLHMPKTYEMNLLHTYDSNQIIIFKPSNKKSVFWIEYVFRCSWTGNASVILNGRGLKDSITSYNYSIQSRPDEHGEYVSAPRKPGTEEYLTNKYIYEYSLQASTSDNFIVRLHTYGVTIQAKLDIYYDAGKIVHIGEVMFYCAMVLMVLILFVSVIIFYYDKNFVNILFILFSASSIIDISVIHFYFSHSPFTYAQEGFWRELTLTSLHAAYSCFVFFAFLSHFLFPVKKQSVWAKLFFLCYGIFMILEIAGDFAPYSKFQYMLRDTTFIKDFLVITSGVSYLIVVYTKLHTKQKAYFILTGIALAVYYSGFLWRGKSGLHPVYKELISYSFVLAECCLLFACVIHLFLEGKKEKKRNFEKANEEMNAILLNQIVKTEEAERRRMSQDLHDDLGGTLSRLKLHMTQLNKNDYVENEDFKKYRDESIQILDAALSDLRQISHNLMPKDFSH
ncbi:MAG: histidine kinase, partial [Sediminibacterium sp.]|nr:histidine kinase [Sediminibacterium sp.]